MKPEERKKLFEEYLAWRELKPKKGWTDLPPEMKKELMEFNYFNSKACKIVDTDDEERTITFRISDETLDRYKEVMNVKGCQVENFRANPVVLWAHNRMQELPAIANARWIKFEKNAIISQAEFAPMDFAMSIYMLYKKKFMHGVSVGYIVLAYTDTYDDDDTPANRIIEKWDLLEYSAVPVPANPNALVTAYKSGDIVIPKLLWKDFELWPEKKHELCTECSCESDPENPCKQSEGEILYTAFMEGKGQPEEQKPNLEPQEEPEAAESAPEDPETKDTTKTDPLEVMRNAIKSGEISKEQLKQEMQQLGLVIEEKPNDEEIDIEEEKEEQIEIEEEDSQNPENSDEGDLQISEEELEKVISTLKEDLKKDFIGEFRRSVLGIVD